MTNESEWQRDQSPIGGFFELEPESGQSDWHDGALSLSNGRACLALILDCLRPRKIYLPFYCCEALYEPSINRCAMSLYSVNRQFEIIEPPNLKDGEYLLYINYFGVKDQYLEILKAAYSERLIIDDAHDFFRQGHVGHWSFCSARKYFGVPDGAYLYSPERIASEFPRNTDISLDHLKNRLAGKLQHAYQQFLSYEATLNSDIKMISQYSQKRLSQVGMERVRKERMTNYRFYQEALGDINHWQYDDTGCEPFCYPMMSAQPVEKSIFHRENIFIPTLWPDLLVRGGMDNHVERDLAQCLLPLPVDHRYATGQLERIIDRVRDCVPR